MSSEAPQSLAVQAGIGKRVALVTGGTRGIGFGVAHNCIAAGILQRNLCSSYEHHMGSVCVCKFTLVKELVTDKHKLWRIFFRALWNRGAKRKKYLNRWIVVNDI